MRQQQCKGQGADWSICHDEAKWSEAKARRQWRECGIVRRWKSGGDDFGREGDDGDGEEKEEGEEGEDGEGRKGRDGWRVVGFIVVWIFSFLFFLGLLGLGLGDSGSFRLAKKAPRRVAQSSGRRRSVR